MIKSNEIKYVDKNKTFNTNGNEWADKLFCMMESNGVLSDTIKTRINNLTLWIVTNHEKYVDKIIDSIEGLETEMTWLTIFSEDFIQRIHYYLHSALDFEMSKNKE